MAKELKELKLFNAGTVISPDVKDIGDEAATYSLNLDTVSSDGKLQAIPQDTNYRLDGTFKDAVDAYDVDTYVKNGDAATLRVSTLIYWVAATGSNASKDFSYNSDTGLGSYDYIRDTHATPINFLTSLFGANATIDDVRGETIFIWTTSSPNDDGTLIDYTEASGYPVPLDADPSSSHPYPGEDLSDDDTVDIAVTAGYAPGNGKPYALILCDIVDHGGGTMNELRFSEGGAPKGDSTDPDVDGAWSSSFSYWGGEHLTGDAGTTGIAGDPYYGIPVAETAYDIGGTNGIENSRGDYRFSAIIGTSPIANLNLSDATMVDEEVTVPIGHPTLTAGAKVVVKNIVGLDKSDTLDNKIVLIEDFYGVLGDPVMRDPVSIGTSTSITSEAFNKQVHIGLGNQPGTLPKWVGRVVPKQLSKESGWVIAPAEPKPIENSSNTCAVDKIITCGNHEIQNDDNSPSVLGKCSFGIQENGRYLYLIDSNEANGTSGQFWKSGDLGHTITSIAAAKGTHGIAEEDDGNMVWILDGIGGTIYLYDIGKDSNGVDWANDKDAWKGNIPYLIARYVIKYGYDFVQFDENNDLAKGAEQSPPSDSFPHDILEIKTGSYNMLWLVSRKFDGEFIEDERFLWVANITDGHKQSNGEDGLKTQEAAPSTGNIEFFDRSPPMAKCSSKNWTGRVGWKIDRGYYEKEHKTVYFDDDTIFRSVLERGGYTRVGMQSNSDHMWEGWNYCLPASSQGHNKLKSYNTAGGDNLNLGVGLGWYPDVAVNVIKYSLVEIHNADDQMGAVGVVLNSGNSFVDRGGQLRIRTAAYPTKVWFSSHQGSLHNTSASFLYMSIGRGTGCFDGSWDPDDYTTEDHHIGEQYVTDDVGFFNVTSGGCFKKYSAPSSYFEDYWEQIDKDGSDENQQNAGGNVGYPAGSTDNRITPALQSAGDGYFFFNGLQTSPNSGVVKGIFELSSSKNTDHMEVESAIVVNPADTAISGTIGEANTFILSSISGSDFEKTIWDAFDLKDAIDISSNNWSYSNAEKEGVATLGKASNWSKDYLETDEADETAGGAILGFIEDNPDSGVFGDTLNASFLSSTKYGRYRNGRTVISYNDSHTGENSMWDWAEPGFTTVQDSPTSYYLGETDADSWSEQDSSIVPTAGGPGDHFVHDQVYRYKISALYDGGQESPLSQSTWRFTPNADCGSVFLAINLMVENEPERWARVTHINLYRADTERDYYLFVLQLNTDKGWAHKQVNDVNVMSRYVVDLHKSGASYEALTGISEVMTNFKLNYALSTQCNSIHVIGRCYHPDITDYIENYIFFSKPFKFDTFDWSATGDFIQLPNIPTAMTAFNGKLYVWDTNNTYRIDPANMTIEDVFEGIGCINNKVVVTTEFGMFFADHNNIYTHDGSTPSAIGEPIARGENEFAWLNRDLTWGKEYGGWDSRRNSYVLIFRKNDKYYAWAYNVARTRWDMWDVGEDEITAIMAGKDGEVLLSKLDKDSLENIITTGHVTQYLSSKNLKRNWEWDSKDITMDYNTQDKIMYNIYSTGDYESNAVYTDGAYDTEHPIAISIDGSDITLEADKDSNITKIPKANKKGKKAKIKVRADNISSEGANKKLDSVGIVFRRRAIK